MKLSSVRPFVRSIIRQPHAAAAGLLLCAHIYIDRLLHGRRSAAKASAVTLTAELNTHLFETIRRRGFCYSKNCVIYNERSGSVSSVR